MSEGNDGSPDSAAVGCRVLHVLGTDRVSGAENVIMTMMDQFVGSDIDMVYCSPDGPIREALAARGLAYQPLSALTPRGVRTAARGFDVVHAHDFKASVVAGQSGFGGRIVSHIHSNPGFVKSWNLFSFVYQGVSRRFDRVVFVSDEAKREVVFARAIEGKARVLYNVVDAARLRALAGAFEVPQRDVLFLGRLVDLKQPQVAIDAVAAARAAVPALTGRLVGGGDLRAACARRIAALGLEDDIALEGFQANPYPFVAASRVALMPSTHEGLGLAAMECLALGVPVLSSGVGGLGDLFAGHARFVCGSVEEYAARVVALCDDAYEEAVAECASIVAPYLDLARYADQVRELYS